MKRCLVTGGTGFIGAALVKRLVKDGFFVRCLDNNSRGAMSKLGKVLKEIEFVEADIRDVEAVQRAAKGMDTILHLAFINGTEFFYTKPDVVLDVGVRGMLNILDACKAQQIKELFLASSSEVYQSPPHIPTDEAAPLSIPDVLNPRYSYAGGKIISELMAINYGRKYIDRVVIFRPHNVYGPDMGWEHVIPQFIIRMKEILKRSKDKKIKFPIQGTGTETRSFVFINDFIDGLILTIEKGEHLGIYHIGTMDEISIKKVAEEIGKYFGRDVDILPSQLAEGGTLRRCPDITRLMKMGYVPKISFQEGLKKTVKWYDENSDNKPSKSTEDNNSEK